MTAPQEATDGAISRRDIEHVALLARLRLDDGEIDDYSAILNRILKHMSKLDELDTEGVEPTSHPTPIPNVMREDIVGPSLPVDEALANAPAMEKNCFKAPRIIQES